MRTVEIQVESYPGQDTWKSETHRFKIQIPSAPKVGLYGTAMALEQAAMRLLDQAAKERAIGRREIIGTTARPELDARRDS